MVNSQSKPIPWFIHIGLGIIVTISSLVAERMRIFIVVGIGLLLWGIIQFFKQKNTAPQKKATQHTQTHPSTNHHQVHHQNQHHQTAHTHHQHHTAHNGLYKGCPSCRATIPRNARFCPYCGYGV